MSAIGRVVSGVIGVGSSLGRATNIISNAYGVATGDSDGYAREIANTVIPGNSVHYGRDDLIEIEHPLDPSPPTNIPQPIVPGPSQDDTNDSYAPSMYPPSREDRIAPEVSDHNDIVTVNDAREDIAEDLASIMKAERILENKTPEEIRQMKRRREERRQRRIRAANGTSYQSGVQYIIAAAALFMLYKAVT
jgi:hypothetical protein